MSKNEIQTKSINRKPIIDIYRGLSKELLKQPTGKKNFKKALVSWKNTGALRRLHKKYSTFTTGKKTQVEWDGKSEHMIPYNRIQEIYNQIRIIKGINNQNIYLPKKKIYNVNNTFKPGFRELYKDFINSCLLKKKKSNFMTSLYDLIQIYKICEIFEKK